METAVPCSAHQGFFAQRMGNCIDAFFAEDIMRGQSAAHCNPLLRPALFVAMLHRKHQLTTDQRAINLHEVDG